MRKIKLGLTFGETLILENRKPKELDREMAPEAMGDKSRTRIFLAIFMVGLLLLTGRAVFLTIVKGQDYRTEANQNRFRVEVIRAPRGLILDRSGQKLTQNIPIFRIERRDKNGSLIGYETTSREEALRRDLLGLTLLTDPGRSYPLGQAAAHTLGYVSEATAEELKNPGSGCQANPLALGDFVGREGIEQEYDCKLRGENGRKISETDTSGRVVRILGEEQPSPGIDLTTTLDARLQQVAYSALGGKDGAVVVMEASNGAVLAMVSSPGYDPNVFSVPQKSQSNLISDVLNNPTAPLLNRALGGAYPAGSVFKLSVSAAALTTGAISPNYTIEDPGIISAGGLTFSNWYYSEYGRKEGKVDVVRALARSTDTFFYQVGALTGPETMAQWAGRFGMGVLTGVDIPGEISGLIPTPSWKIKAKGEQWYLGNTYNMSIGQGDVLVTPLQVAQMTQAIANDGSLCRPFFVGGRENCHSMGLKPDVRQLVVSGMIGACSTGGTAYPLFDFKPQVACKTGTAQFGVEGKLTHAWLTAFAPVDHPQIVVTALVEGGGEGSAIAAPIAKAVLSEWFGRN